MRRKQNEIFLHPSKVVFFKGPKVIKTLLGSCVAVSMFDRGTGTAAICHAVLPHSPKDWSGNDSEVFHFVDTAISAMISEFVRRGIQPKNLEVKLFGGAACDFPDLGHFSVGPQNIKAAKSSIESHGLRLKTSDTGGSFGRQALFFADTGEVWIRRFNTGV